MLAVEALQKAGVHITDRELDDVLIRVVSKMIRSPLPRTPRQELMDAEAATLERGGLSLEPVDEIGAHDPLVETAAIYASLLVTSLTVSQAATVLGISMGRVRQELYVGDRLSSDDRCVYESVLTALPTLWEKRTELAGQESAHRVAGCLATAYPEGRGTGIRRGGAVNG